MNGTLAFTPWGSEERLLVSVALVVALAIFLWILRYRRRDLGSWWTARTGVLVLLTVAFVSVMATAATLIVLWGLTDELLESMVSLQVEAVTGGRVALTVGVLAGAYIATGGIKRIVNQLLIDRSHVTRHQVEIVFRVFQVLLYVLATVIILRVWSVDLDGLLVGAGFLGIVLGLAAQQTLGSLIAGFVLMFARPFEIGDWVEIGDYEGIVTDITIVNTRVQTFDGEYVMIPNDEVGSNIVTNRTRKGRLRIQIEVGIDYATDLDRAIDVARQAMVDVEEILTVPAPSVVLIQFSDSSVIMGCRFWIDKPSARRRWRAQTAVITSIKRSFDREDIEIPFPQRTHTFRTQTGNASLSAEPSGGVSTEFGGGEQ